MMKKIVGQTLVEALVTVVIVALGVIALVRFQNYLSYDNSVAQQTSQAQIIAQSTIENIRNFQVLNNTSGYTSYASISSGTSSVTGVSATYTVTWTVNTFTNPSYKRITVVVAWTDRRGTAQSVTLISNIAGIEPANSAAVM